MFGKFWTFKSFWTFWISGHFRHLNEFRQFRLYFISAVLDIFDILDVLDIRLLYSLKSLWVNGISEYCKPPEQQSPRGPKHKHQIAQNWLGHQTTGDSNIRPLVPSNQNNRTAKVTRAPDARVPKHQNCAGQQSSWDSDSLVACPWCFGPG